MTLKIFLEVVEIRTEVASVLPFAVEVLFSIALFHEMHWLNTFLFSIGMLVFDLVATAINNYMGYEKAHSEIYKYEENVIGRRDLSPVLIRNMILAMIAFVFIIGVVLAVSTGWLLLLMGFICCFIGVFYTFGPVPLSRMPLGEISSGVTMGLGIFAMVVCVNTFGSDVYDLTVNPSSGQFVLVGNLWVMAAIVLASLPLVFTITSIMLANDLQDLDRDIRNHRYTLVFYIGRPAGTVLFQLLMYACYFMILMGLLSGIYEWPILVTLLTLPIVKKHLDQSKQTLPQPTSFSYSIKNMVLFNTSYVLGLLLTIIMRAI